MAGSVFRLTVVIVLFNMPKFSVFQQPESWFHNPFRLKTSFLKEYLQRRDELFPYSFTKSTTSPFPTANTGTDGQLLRRRQDEYRANTVKRKIARPALENRRVQNIIRHVLKESLQGNLSSEKTEQIRRILYKNNVTEVDKLDNPILQQSLKHESEREEIHSDNDQSPQQSVYTTNIVSPYYHSQLNEINKDTPKKTIIPVNRIKPPFSEEESEGEKSKVSFLGYVIHTLTQLPIIGNVLRASVDPLYRPIVKTLQSDEAGKENIMSGELDSKNWCFGVLGCLELTHDFFHPIYRPLNLPPYQRQQIDTKFAFISRNDTQGTVVRALNIEDTEDTSFSKDRNTKIIVHGYLNDRNETWIWEMARGFLHHGDYNVITVDWSGGSFALYSQATANTRIVALEIVRLISWLMLNYGISPSSVHIVGHSLGAHTAGYVGERIQGIGRITGLDPAEPFFQYMPSNVRLDPSDANFVDVIHTDSDSFFALTGPRGFGLEQAVGHVDFFPNGGREQPGCNQLLTTVPITLLNEGIDIVEGINAAQTEIMNCDHVRAPKLFTDSLTSDCPYLGFVCSSYRNYKEGKCFSCGTNGENCSSMGINADRWNRGNQSLVKMFLDTHISPNFCKYHYLLTINFADPVISTGTLRGRLKVSLITEDGDIRKFDLTALSPLKFPRRGSRTFMLEHFEDLSSSQEALLQWIFESDLLDPFTFCLIFCKADLSVSSVTLMSIDTKTAVARLERIRSRSTAAVMKETKNDSVFNGGSVVMCHKRGEGVVVIPSESTVKISASPYCHQSQQELQQQQDQVNQKVQGDQRVHQDSEVQHNKSVQMDRLPTLAAPEPSLSHSVQHKPVEFESLH